jgi:iron complex transport system substrate-binding protein
MKRFFLTLIATLMTTPCSAEEDPCARIISLSPSITEVIFELGLGPKLVGVTRYCRYPAEAQSVTKVGGFYDMSLENILSLKPTHVFGLRENAEIRQSLRKFGVPTEEIDHTTVEGIKRSIVTVGEVCGVQALAIKKLAELEGRERALRARRTGSPSYRTLIIVGRMHEGDSLSGIYVSGKDGFYTGVIELLGMKNVNADPTVAVPMLSAEGFMALAPEAIVEVVNVDDPALRGAPSAAWNRFPQVPAVKNSRIFTLSDDFASIPGPRYIALAEKLADLLERRERP